ncbi:MAG: CDP-glycerol glycerophosphotransferase family protein [Patescibacteria group bacterium]
MKTLFLFIPHYFFSSDLLHTDYIKLLSQKYKVVVFSPVFTASDPKNYYQSENITYIPWQELRPKFWSFFTKTLRLSMIREFDNLEYFKLRRLMKINLNWQRKLLRSISWFIPRILLTSDFFTKIEYLLTPNSKIFLGYLKKYNPSIIVTCTPGFGYTEPEIIILAKKNNLKTVSINSSWDNFTSNATQFRKTDYIICWNEVMRKEAISIHNYNPNKVFVSGIYRFDHHFEKHENELSREEFLKSKNLDPSRKTLLLSTVPPNTYPPQYSVWRKIIQKHKENAFGEPVNLFIRLHPNDSLEKYKEFEGINNVHIELPGKQKNKTVSGGHKIEMDEEDLNNLRYSLKYTDININFRSSLSLEATIYDKPIINIALDNYANRYHVDWYIPIIESGGVRLVTTEDELNKAIIDYLNHPEKDKDGRKKIFNDYIGFSDGLSYKRSAEAVEHILKTIS